MDYNISDDDSNEMVSSLATRFIQSSSSSSNNATVGGSGLGLRPKKGTIKKIIRNQKTFLDLFNKYRCEVRNLQITIDSRFKKLSAMEERLLNLGHVLQSDSQLYLFKKQHNRKLQAISNMNLQLNNNNNNNNNSQHTTYQQQTDSFKQENKFDNDSGGGGGSSGTKTINNNIPYCHNFNSVIEPIIDIFVNDNQDDDDVDDQDGGTDGNHSNIGNNSNNNGNVHHYQMIQSSSAIGTMGSSNNNSDNDDDDVNGIDTMDEMSRPNNNDCGDDGQLNLVVNSGRRISMPITSKTQFMQLIAENRQRNNLMKEKVARNVFALHTKDSDMVLGYQCSITGCSYMHFLRAQVNRHFKNYHSKTCSHCNQRFKRPIDLLVHMKEYDVPGVELLQLQVDSQTSEFNNNNNN